jgi:hypothetical protein
VDDFPSGTHNSAAAPAHGIQSQVSINYEAVIILKLLTMVAVLAHVEACLFWFVGDVQGEAGWMHELGVNEVVGDVSAPASCLFSAMLVLIIATVLLDSIPTNSPSRVNFAFP